MNNNKMKFWLIIPVCAIVLLLGGTYAWYVWQTTQDEETIIATDTGYATVFFDGGSSVNGKLKPVSDKTKGMLKTIRVSADKQFIEPISFNLYLDINSIDAGLKHESFKFELHKDGELVKAGNFSDGYLNSYLSNCETNTGKRHITLASDVVTTTESVYTLYTWIDGNMNNPLSMESQSFDFTLHASGQHAILGDKEQSNEEEVIDGIVHNDKNQGRFYRGVDIENLTLTPYFGDLMDYIFSCGSDVIFAEYVGEPFPETNQIGDIYLYDNVLYVYGYYIEMVNEQDYLQGMSNNGYSSEVGLLTLPNETNHKSILLGENDLVYVLTPAAGHYDEFEGWCAISQKRTGMLPESTELLTMINNSKVINLSGLNAYTTDYDTDKLFNVPSTVKYMDYYFYENFGGSDESSFYINSKNVVSIKRMFYNSQFEYGKELEIFVPENSITYNTFMTAKANGEIPSSVTITTFEKQ